MKKKNPFNSKLKSLELKKNRSNRSDTGLATKKLVMDRCSKTTRKKNQTQGQKHERNLFKDGLYSLLLALILLAIIICFFFKFQIVATSNMFPNFKRGEGLIVQKNRVVKRFDVILFKGRDGRRHLSRVVGFPGEKIEYENDYLLINDLSITEKFLVDEVNAYQKKGEIYTTDFIAISETPVDITKKRQNNKPADAYYVMGDARPSSDDSRNFGWVHKEKLIGVVSGKLWPLSKIEWY